MEKKRLLYMVISAISLAVGVALALLIAAAVETVSPKEERLAAEVARLENELLEAANQRAGLQDELGKTRRQLASADSDRTASEQQLLELKNASGKMASGPAAIEFFRRIWKEAPSYAEAKRLRGIDAFIISVHGLPRNSPKEVVREDVVTAKFELKLRQAGIPFRRMSEIEQDTAPINWPMSTLVEARLDLNVYALRSPVEGYVSCEVRATASAPELTRRNDEIHRTFADAWYDGDSQLVPADAAQKAILDSVEQRAEVFANAYLTANPKTRDVAK